VLDGHAVDVAIAKTSVQVERHCGHFGGTLGQLIATLGPFEFGEPLELGAWLGLGASFELEHAVIVVAQMRVRMNEKS
jgi:hypothetical protein